MIKKENTPKWYQIEIEDVDILSGKNLITLVEYLNKSIEIKFIVMDDMDDMDGNIGEFLFSKEKPLLVDLKTFTKLAKQVAQFDWGYFFLCFNKINAEKILSAINSKEPTQFDYVDIPDTSTTVRIFDNTSFIIYTNRLGVVETIRKQYPTAEIEQKDIEKLEFYF